MVRRFPVPLWLVRLAAAGGLAAWAVSRVANADQPAIAIAGAALATVGLATKPRLPIVVLGAVLVGMLIAAGPGGFDGADDPFMVALVWASYGVGRHSSLRHQPWAAAFMLLYLSIVVSADVFVFPAMLVFPALFSVAPWVTGLWTRWLEERSSAVLQLAAETTLERSHAVRRATVEERLRIARELHDVAAHHMTTVSLQSQVLREQVNRGATLVGDDLATIERSAQTALSEIRRVVGVLRLPDDEAAYEPLPTLADLPALVDASQQAGQVVSFVVTGVARPVPDGIALTLYRVAQEALSNARRHGASSPTKLTLTWQPTCVTLRSENRVSSLARRFVAGNGIVGMRERVELYGGCLDAGPDDRGVWAVEATLPVPS